MGEIGAGSRQFHGGHVNRCMALVMAGFAVSGDPTAVRWLVRHGCRQGGGRSCVGRVILDQWSRVSMVIPIHAFDQCRRLEIQRRGFDLGMGSCGSLIADRGARMAYWSFNRDKLI
jgi:hypothetical protein